MDHAAKRNKIDREALLAKFLDSSGHVLPTVSLSKLLLKLVNEAYLELMNLANFLSDLTVVDRGSTGREAVVKYTAVMRARFSKIHKLISFLSANQKTLDTDYATLKSHCAKSYSYGWAADSLVGCHQKYISLVKPKTVPLAVTHITKRDASQDVKDASSCLSTFVTVKVPFLHALEVHGYTIHHVKGREYFHISDALTRCCITVVLSNECQDGIGWKLLCWDVLLKTADDPRVDALPLGLDAQTNQSVNAVVDRLLYRGDLQGGLGVLRQVGQTMMMEIVQEQARYLAAQNPWVRYKHEKATTTLVYWEDEKVSVAIHADLQAPLVTEHPDPRLLNTQLKPISMKNLLSQALQHSKRKVLQHCAQELTMQGYVTQLEDAGLKVRLRSGCFESGVDVIANDMGLVSLTSQHVGHLALVPVREVLNWMLEAGTASIKAQVMLNLVESGSLLPAMPKQIVVQDGNLIKTFLPFEGIRVELEINVLQKTVVIISSYAPPSVSRKATGMPMLLAVACAAVLSIVPCSVDLAEPPVRKLELLPSPLQTDDLFATPKQAMNFCTAQTWIVAWRMLAQQGLQHHLQGQVDDRVLKNGRPDLERDDGVPDLTNGTTLVMCASDHGYYWTVQHSNNGCRVGMLVRVGDSAAQLSAGILRGLSKKGSSKDGWVMLGLGALSMLLREAVLLDVDTNEALRVGYVLTKRAEAVRGFCKVFKIETTTVVHGDVTVTLNCSGGCSHPMGISLNVAIKGISDPRTKTMASAFGKTLLHVVIGTLPAEMHGVCEVFFRWIRSVADLPAALLPINLGDWARALVVDHATATLQLLDPSNEKICIVTHSDLKG
eukprot:TRINITY_DN26855_c0_g1_i1.p1 TRINITY_DN26855_c0_g1~~TRINITY_DN26855_c0_g1_i1.p1  ORF type:complete len:850 (+),score=151.68 TRINITY_DN26855_c0_g1_i1:47-2551(+)